MKIYLGDFRRFFDVNDSRGVKLSGVIDTTEFFMTPQSCLFIMTSCSLYRDNLIKKSFMGHIQYLK